MIPRWIFLLSLFILLLAACTPAASPTPTITIAPSPTAANAPAATPLPPEVQALLDQREVTAHEMSRSMELARGQGQSQEQIDAIIRAYVPTIEAIEQTLAQRGVEVPPLPLPPTPPPLTKKTQFDIGMVTKDGVHIKGTYYQPAATNAPGVLLLHMLGRQRQDWDAFARQLQDAGYGVLAIDLRGHGESDGQREWSKMTADAAIGVDYLRSRPEIDPHRIVIIGASIGANIAINYAAQDADIVGVALLSPGLDYHGVKTEDAVKQYGVRPLFIAASSEDKYAAQSARKLDSLAQGPHELHILENQGHGTQMLGKGNGLETLIMQWLAAVVQ